MVTSTICNHYLIWIFLLAVDMKNTGEASLYCRCLEIITSSPHKMLKMQTMCSSSFSGKEQRTHCSTCVAVADFVLDAPFFTEVLPVECGAVN